jgi:hypothetical protein
MCEGWGGGAEALERGFEGVRELARRLGHDGHVGHLRLPLLHLQVAHAVAVSRRQHHVEAHAAVAAPQHAQHRERKDEEAGGGSRND